MYFSRVYGFLFVLIFIAGCSPRVPYVVGLKADKAEKELQQTGFKSSLIFEEKPEARVGEVFSQQPSPPDRAPKGSIVKISIAKGARIIGMFRLTDIDITRRELGCVGKGGYSDIGPHMQVVVMNGKRDIIATGTLEPDYSSDGEDDYTCTYPFTIEDVPITNFYEIEIGRRGSVKFSLEEMKRKDWSLILSIGEN